MSEAQLVKVTEVVLDPDIFPRSAVDEQTVSRYVDALSEGEDFPAIIIETGTGRLFDGWHRYRAHLRVGSLEILAEAREVPAGMSPKLFAASLSSKHGLPLQEDDEKSLARELFDAEGDTSVTSVAKALGRPRKTVEGWLSDQIESRRQAEAHERNVRRVLALMLREIGWTQQRIGDHLGIDRSAVSRVCDGEPANTHDLDERELRDAVALAPEGIDLESIAEQWREQRIFATWTDDERHLLKQLRDGATVVANMRGDAHPRLWKWAEQSGLGVRIDRKGPWGNPFIVGEDGNRDQVCDAYEKHYLPHKPSLRDFHERLAGKVLGCWCAPLRCHGDLFARDCNDGTLS